MSDGFLHKYFLNNSSKRLHKWNHYFDIYERHLSRFRGKNLVMLEIGVFGGGSLDMWRTYLGTEVKIIGIDINPECKQYESDGIEIFIGSQDDSTLIDEILKKYPNISIVLDDGSHVMQHMNASFELLYHHLDPNGVYIVEDTHTCYWPEYQGGLRQENSFIENVKNKIDELNAVHTRSAVAVSKFTKSTDSICIYDSIVVFEKRPQGIRQAPITGPM
jgi:cephalosporin hydroxylase